MCADLKLQIVDEVFSSSVTQFPNPHSK